MIPKFNHSQINYHTGFTLIETFVAITVLMIAVLGPMSLLSRALISANYIKNEITAGYLAQEGLEAVIAYSRVSGSSAWLASHSDGSSKFKVDLSVSNSISPPEACGVSCGYLKLGNDGYGYVNGNSTLFRREIVITKITAKQYKIVSTVLRRERNSPIERSISSISYIFK